MSLHKNRLWEMKKRKLAISFVFVLISNKYQYYDNKSNGDSKRTNTTAIICIIHYLTQCNTNFLNHFLTICTKITKTNTTLRLRRWQIWTDINYVYMHYFNTDIFSLRSAQEIVNSKFAKHHSDMLSVNSAEPVFCKV